MSQKQTRNNKFNSDQFQFQSIQLIETRQLHTVPASIRGICELRLSAERQLRVDQQLTEYFNRDDLRLRLTNAIVRSA